MTPLSSLLRSSLFFFAASYASAQVTITFDDLVLANYAPIPGDYGSQLDPRIAVSYRTFEETTGVEIQPYVEFWNNDYGDLSKVAFAAENGRAAEIAFTPVAGYAVNLISFEMAGYSHADLTNSYMRLVDAANNIVFDFAALGPVAIEGNSTGAQHSVFTPNLTFDGKLRLQWGPDWNVGIDNIRFQAVAIPEPSSVVLVGLGLAGLAAQRWRRKKAPVSRGP